MIGHRDHFILKDAIRDRRKSPSRRDRVSRIDALEVSVNDIHLWDQQPMASGKGYVEIPAETHNIVLIHVSYIYKHPH